MVLVLHIITALGSLLAAGVAYMNPTKLTIRLSYALTALMLASGTYLVVLNSAHLLRACITGLSLLAVVTYVTSLARHKLAKQPEN